MPLIYQYKQSAQIQRVYTSTLKSVHDATQGQSGASAWKLSNQIVRGVLIKGAGSSTFLTRIRTGVFDFICSAIHDNPTTDDHACS